MDWATGIQNSIDYIEQHITDELDYEQIAAQAACSSFYFQRIFGVLCGMTLGEYIRSRRLSLAGRDVVSSDEKIIDIALKYGYESPESFTRAFARFHGVTPTEARRGSQRLRSFSPLKVQIILKGGNTMNYKIVEKPAFKVIEKVERHSVVDKQNKNTIPDFWDRSHNDGTIETLLKSASDASYIFGICYNSDHTDDNTFDYAIAAMCKDDAKAPDGYRISEIPARTWVVSECTGAMPEAIQNLWHQLCSEFFPTSDCKPTCEMDIEAYTYGYMTSPDYKSEIWVSIEKN